MMLVTLHLEGSGEGCSDVFFNMGYAIWDGSSWELAYDGGCPRHWAAVQAPYPVPLGGGRYKIYFNPPTTTNIMEPGAMHSKPMKVLYADASASGDGSKLEFEDFESVDDARDITYLWADGTELTTEEESKLDDYQVYSPTGDPEHLILLSNMACEGGCGPPFAGLLFLLNP